MGVAIEEEVAAIILWKYKTENIISVRPFSLQLPHFCEIAISKFFFAFLQVIHFCIFNSVEQLFRCTTFSLHKMSSKPSGRRIKNFNSKASSESVKAPQMR